MTERRSRRATPGKLLGDAGEHYALSQLSFAGNYAAKMPDNWEAYDLAVESADGLVRVSVKTRSETRAWKSASWFSFDDRKDCDWLVLIFKQAESLRSWVIPFDVALQNANIPGPTRKEPWTRDITLAKLNRSPLKQYEDNWALERLKPLEPNDRLLAAFEGGAVYIAERDGEFLVIIQQVALLDLLDEGWLQWGKPTADFFFGLGIGIDRDIACVAPPVPFTPVAIQMLDLLTAQVMLSVESMVM